MNQNSAIQNNGFDFEVPEFNLRNHSWLWYIIIFLFFAAVLVISIKTNQLTLAFLVVLAAIVYYEISLVNPKKNNISFSKYGITYKKMFYPWQVFKSFTLFGEGENQAVHLDKLTFASGPLVIALPSSGNIKYKNKNISNQAMFLTILRYYLPEKLRAKMNLSDWLNKIFRV